MSGLEPNQRLTPQQIIDKLLQAVREPAEAKQEQAHDKYLSWLIDTYQYLDFKGIVQLRQLPVRLPLESLYISLFVHPGLPTGETWDREARIAGRPFDVSDLASELADRVADRARLSKSITVEQALAQSRSFVLLGDPGSGKTTILKYLALTFARNEARSRLGFSEQRLPILLPISAYAAALKASPRVSLNEYISAYFREVRNFPYDLGEEFETALESGTALVLLDGLDEVTESAQRSFIVARVLDFYNIYYAKGNRFIITSRIVGYRDAPLVTGGLPHFTLIDFTRQEIESFADKWTTTLNLALGGDISQRRREAQIERVKLIDSIQSNPRIERLAANPLLLTILALIHQMRGELPSKRVQLYDLCMNTLLYSWARGRDLDHRPIKPLEETEAIRILAPFAYWLHNTKPGGTARRDEIEFKLSELYQEKLKYPAHEAIATAHQFLEDVRQYAGILADRGESQYGFVHLTFEEYLAAREIIFQGQLDRTACVHVLLQHVFEASWREVALLAVDYLSLITNEQDAARMLIESILTSTPPVGSEGLNVVIAGECIADVGLNGAGRECGSRVQNALLQTMIDSAVPLTQRWRAGSLLGTIGDPRFPSNEVSVDLVDVSEGTVELGSTQEEVDPLIEEVGKVELEPQLEWVRHYWTMTIQSEVPRHPVEVQKFRIGRYPVTNAEYFRFISSNPSQPVPYLDSDRAKPFNWNQELRTYPVGRGNEPVVLVSWRDVCLYCEWLSAITGRRFRLPTEAEWELAARGRQGSIYPWGSSWQPTYVNSSEAGAKGPVAVGCYPEGASPFEVLDCAGQVWEWINTRWGDRWRQLRFPYPYRHNDGREISHPCRPMIRPGSGAIPEDLGDWRIVKGGSWDDLGAFARCASRGPNTIDFRSYYIGFRIAESVSEAKE